jgi:hypothetical protein
MPNPSHPDYFVVGNQYKVRSRNYPGTYIMTYMGRQQSPYLGTMAYNFRGDGMGVSIPRAQLDDGTFTVEPESLDPGPVNNSGRKNKNNKSGDPQGGGRRRRTRRKTAKQNLRRRRG